MVNSLKASYDEIFKKIAVMLNLVGLNIFKKSFNIRQTIFIIVDIIIFAVILCYSVRYFRNDYLRVAICVVPSFYGVQGCSKIYTQIIEMNDMLTINKIINDFYTYIEDKYYKMKTSLNKKLEICILVTNLMWKTYVISASIVAILPSIITATTKYNLLPFGFVLPWISYESYPGYEINYLYHLLQIHFVVLSISGTDSLCLLYIYNGCLQIEAIILMLAELDNLLESYDSNKQTIEVIINDIIERHQIQRRYMERIDQVYKLNFFIEISTDVIQIMLVLIVNSWSTWYLGIVFAFASSIQILCVCFLGTYIIIIHEKLEQAIYNIKWYNLDIKKQKYILMILMVAQQPNNLTIGGMFSLDLKTFLQIYKFIYSFSMMLQNMKVN